MKPVGLILLWGGLMLPFAGAQEPTPQVLEQKDLEIYNLKAELEYYKQQWQKLREDNIRLRDSLQAQSAPTQPPSTPEKDANLRVLYQTLNEDHTLAQEIIADIQTKAVAPTPSRSSAGEDSSFTQRYNAALNQYFEGHYQQAANQFEQLLQQRRDHPLSDNCQYWLGECYYARRQYTEAIPIFQGVKTLGDRNKADAAQFKIGLAYWQLGKRAEAIKAFKELERDFPDSELIPRARQYYQQPEKF